ncbi:hypothetical protein GJ496_006964 [Pomphorhynchus laevis]|nr:hypothetical protein GJ496_006964 [Pomphorhynchus laevis]
MIQMTMLSEFRQYILDKIDDDDSTLFNENDVKRFQNDDYYANCFLLQSNNNFEQAYILLEQCFAWRQSFQVHSINAETSCKRVFDSGLLYVRGQSLKKSDILRIQISQNVRGRFTDKEMRSSIVHILENHSIRSHRPIIVLFDLTNTGIKNVDLEFVKFMISCLKIYYPQMLDMILAYDMPWVMNAAWKLIKSWLGQDAINKVNFVDSVSISRFINKANLPLHMGGTDEYTFDGTLFSNVAEAKNGEATPEFKPRKSSELQEINSELLISPFDELTFDLNNQNETTWKYITLKNAGKCALAYKFKSTSPEKFVVRPGTGELKSDSEIKVRISINSAVLCTQSVNEDKFIVLYKSVNDPITDISKFWRKYHKDESVNTHKIRCCILPASDDQANLRLLLMDPNLQRRYHQYLENSKIMKTIQEIHSEQKSMKSNFLFVVFRRPFSN